MTSSMFASDVRQTLDQFRRSVDQLFENFYGYPTEPGRALTPGLGSQWLFSPPVETNWGETALNLRAIVPGIAQQDLRVSVQNNQLVIEGERKSPEWASKNAYTQLTYGRFRTEMSLPAGLDVDKLHAHLHDGVLDIQIPLAEKMKPRQIQIQSGESRKSITA